MVHVFECVVHEPKPQRFNPNYFKSTPNKVTEGNRLFWSKDVVVGGSICRKCWSKFAHRSRDEVGRVDILPKDIIVLPDQRYTVQ
jgi:hypothetical protein